MPRQVPPHPSLEHFRKQAKQLLRDVRSGDGGSCARVRRTHPRWSSPAGDMQQSLSLHDAQLTISREFGYASWRRLQDAVAREQIPETPGQRVLITGGAGFIGSHLAESLLARGRQVTCLDDLSTGPRTNVAHLEGDDHFELVVGDICDAGLVDTLVAQADVVYHLAAVTGVCADSHDPLALLRTNIDGTEVVVEAASRYGVRFLLASTSMVYGKTQGRELLREDSDLVLGGGDEPGWGYALSKAANERLTLAHAAKHDIRATVVRLFNVIGPRQRDTVMPIFVRQATTGEALTVHGDGTHRRCFTDVRDVVEGMARLADCEAACGEVVNIGSRHDHSVQRLADAVRFATHSDSSVEYIPYDRLPYGDFQRHMPYKVPCLSKARQLIGYSAVHPLEETLQEIVTLGPDPDAS